VTLDQAIQLLISEVGDAAGIPILALDEQGACALTFDDKICVNLRYQENEEQIWVYSVIGAPKSPDAVYRQLLQANLSYRTARGATFSLSGDEPPNVVVIQSMEWRGKRGVELMREISDFASLAEVWKKVVAAETDDNLSLASQPLALGDQMAMIRC
jgi:hypothetical protein